MGRRLELWLYSTTVVLWPHHEDKAVIPQRRKFSQIVNRGIGSKRNIETHDIVDTDNMFLARP